MINVIRRPPGPARKLSPSRRRRWRGCRGRTDDRRAGGEGKARESTPRSRQEGAPPPDRPAASPREARQAVHGAASTDSAERSTTAAACSTRPGADLNHPPPELEDPAERARVGRGRARRARGGARAVPRAEPPAIVFTRFGTSGGAQLEDLVAELQASGLAAAPERVFGAYRVPERFGHLRNREKRAYVEWEIAHRPGALPATDGGRRRARFARALKWVLGGRASRRCSTRT